MPLSTQRLHFEQCVIHGFLIYLLYYIAIETTVNPL